MGGSPASGPAAHGSSLPRRVVVMLGASNLMRGLATALGIAYRLWGGPLDVLAACGLGRSYGLRMPFLWRELPGIADCGLWQALAQRPSAPTAALVTDIGNDLLYDVPVPHIVAWVETCLDRLLRAGARVVLTPLPLCSVVSVSRARFLAVRSILFPGCRRSYATVLNRATDLDRRLRSLAETRGAVLVEHRPEWYGFDPIHIRWRRRLAAWGSILAPLSEEARADEVSVQHRRWLRLGRLVPERRWLFGWEQHTSQPCCQLADGTTLALY